MPIPAFLITPGDPAGIGIDVTLKAAQQPFDAALIVVGDPIVFRERAAQLGINIKLHECDLSADAPHIAGSLHIHPVPFHGKVIAGKLNKEHAATVLASLKLATDACLAGKAAGLITGPIHKGVMNEAGIPFTGHTEFLATACGAKQTVMLFVVDQLKAALVTTHIPLQQVTSAITPEKLVQVITIMQHGLQQYFHITNPTLLIAGINPHAGENGYIGKEELTVLNPTLEKLRQQGASLIGPLPADTIFTPTVLTQGDAVLGMYHDQILPVIKQIGFDRAVNMTLGLPFIRTSVDHGTALDLAGTGLANAGSMVAAINLAISTQPSLNG